MPSPKKALEKAISEFANFTTPRLTAQERQKKVAEAAAAAVKAPEAQTA